MNKENQEVIRNLSRREFLRLAGLTAGSMALLAGCGAAATPAPQQEPAAAEKPAEASEEEKPAEAPAAEATTISWWNQYSTPTTQEMIPLIIKQYEETYPDVKVDYELTGGPPGGGNFDEVLLARIAAGNSPDVTTLFSPPVPFAARGSLLEIDDLMASAQWAKADAFYASPLKSCQWQGKTYGLPSSAGPGAIFIAVDKFKEKGISTEAEDFPKSWDDLKALSAEFVVWENDELKQAGFVPWTNDWLYPAWSGLNGGTLFDTENIAYALDSEQNVEWLNYMVQWLDEQYGGDIEKFNLYGQWSGAYPDSAFHQGKAGLVQDGSWVTTDAEIPFEWEIFKFATGPSGSTSMTGFWPNWWAIPAGSPHPKESFLFIEFFATKGWETWYQYIMDTPVWKDFPADVLTKKLVDQVGEERAKEVHQFFTSYLENAVEMWTSPIEDFARSTLGSAVDQILHKTKSPVEALGEAQGIVKAKLQETVGG